VSDADLARVLERVKRLRALATSSNVHEAATASAKADRLMQQHGLTSAMLEAQGAEGEAAREQDEPLATWSAKGRAKPRDWELVLAEEITTHYGCACLVEMGRDRPKGPLVYTEVVLFGRPSDVACVREQYTWLRATIRRLAARGRRSAEQRDAFGLGAVAGVMDVLALAKRETRAHAGASSTALAIFDGRADAAAKLRDSLHQVKGARAVKEPADDDALLDGFEAGRKLGARAHARADKTAKLPKENRP
jgi:hypothetical protein